MKKFSSRVDAIFASNDTNYEEMNNLMQDLALNKEIFNGERVISKAEANAKVLDFSRQILGISDINDKKAIRRAIRDNGREFMDIIEDTIDLTITTGLKESDWFNSLVDYRNIAYGDRQDFKIEKEGYLAVAKAGTSHHSHIIQRLRGGEVISVPTTLYVVEVGADINKYVLGQTNWTELVAAITKAYVKKIQTEVYGCFGTAVSSIPAALQSLFIGTGTPGTSTKNAFDTILDNVSAENDGARVIIMGTKTALRKVTAWADVDWGSSGQKDGIAGNGYLPTYEGTTLVEIPNRFSDESRSSKVFDTNKLYIFPSNDSDKFIKFVDEGDTEILEKMERGDYVSDIQTYEVQRRFGSAVALGKYFGQWTIQ